ncbi:Stc1 domain-containing protein [Dissophora ornata]|nr:hypothetical protein BGZ58_008274 [Dissophora ornata]KAI8594576.1 Stc1 domain-containing protein [Dissophora ornata]
MSRYHNQRPNTGDGRAPNPASNRQVPKDLRASGSNGVYCYGCEATKPRQAFSETQLKKASNRGANHQIMCKNCIPSQATSLKCIRCSKTLPLDSFSKTQRKRQERAICLDCRELITKEDSEVDDVDVDIEEDEEYYDTDIRDIL